MRWPIHPSLQRKQIPACPAAPWVLTQKFTWVQTSVLRSLLVSVPGLQILAIKELCLQCKRCAGFHQAQPLLSCKTPPLVFINSLAVSKTRKETGLSLYPFLNFCKISSLPLSFSQLQDLQISWFFWMRQCLPEPPSLICLTLIFLLLLLAFKAPGDTQQYFGLNIPVQ